MLGHAIQTERNTTAMQLVKKIKKKMFRAKPINKKDGKKIKALSLDSHRKWNGQALLLCPALRKVETTGK